MEVFRLVLLKTLRVQNPQLVHPMPQVVEEHQVSVVLELEPHLLRVHLRLAQRLRCRDGRDLVQESELSLRLLEHWLHQLDYALQ
jgi:hypothetical protein